MKRRDQSKHKKTMSIRTRLIVLFTSFTALALVMLLLFQLLFLDYFYRTIKMRSIESASREIIDAVGTDELDEYMEYWHLKEQFDILVVNRNGEIIYKEVVEGTEPGRFKSEDLKAVYDAAEKNGGVYTSQSAITLKTPPRGEGKAEPTPPTDKPHDKSDARPEKDEVYQSMVYATITTDAQTDISYMVLIHAFLTPVSATVRTLVFQFSFAVLVLVLFAVVVSRMIAKRIARPITAINKAAKELSEGQYTPPDSVGFREAEELNATLLRASQDLRRSEELQQELFANVSHDLRTPLTMIIGYGEAIRDLPGENSAENIQVMIDEANRLNRLVNDVLDLSKLQAGTQPIESESLDLTQLVGDVAERCRRMTSFSEYSVTFEYEEEATVFGDELRLSQAIYNLLGNALGHAGEDKQVIVRQTVTDETVRIAVIDHGKGIPEEEQEHIWKRYYQVRGADGSNGIVSSGLGLSIVHAVVALHNGTCGVESTLGQGSTFWFELPLCNE